MKPSQLEILGNEQVVDQRLLDRLRDSCPLFLQSFDMELAFCRVSKVPAVQYGEPVEPFFQEVPQFVLVLGLELSTGNLQHAMNDLLADFLEEGIRKFGASSQG